MHGLDIVAIDRLARHGVRRSPVGDPLDLLVRGAGHEVGVAVVLTDEDRRHLPQRRHVERLVEDADVGGAVAQEGHRDAVEALHPARQRRSGRDGDAGPDDPVRPQDPEVEVGHVHRPALSAAVARRLPVQLGEEPGQISTLGKDVTVPAMGRGEVIVGAQRRAHAGRGGLLADVGVDEPRHSPGREQLYQTFLRLPDQDHDPVHAEQLFGIRGHAILLPATREAPDGRSYPARARRSLQPPLTLRMAGATLAR